MGYVNPDEVNKLLYPLNCTSIHEISARKLNGEVIKLDMYKGHVCIIVNICSNSPISAICFKHMNKLIDDYGTTKGLRILAFPCDQFGLDQEPRDNYQLQEFFEKLPAKFDVFEKVKVNSAEACSLFRFLKSKLPSEFGAMIKSPFTKFIVDADGIPEERFEVDVMIKDMVPFLKTYWDPSVAEEQVAKVPAVAQRVKTVEYKKVNTNRVTAIIERLQKRAQQFSASHKKCAEGKNPDPRP